MRKGKTTIRFWLRTDKADTDNLCPVHLIYQISGQRRYFAVPEVKLLSKNWDAETQKAVYKTGKGLPSANKIKSINLKLQDIEKVITDEIEARFKLDKVVFDVDMVIEKLRDHYTTTKKAEPSKYVSDFIKTFIEDSKATHTKGTLKVYNSLNNHLKTFIKSTGRSDSFDNMNVQFFKTFFSYLTDKAKMLNVTAAKQLSTLKSLLNKARKEYSIEVNPGFKDYTASRGDGQFDIIHFTFDEFETLYNMPKLDRRLAEARDILCFSCTTGLRDSDLRQLTWSHIKHGVISMTAHKTKQKLAIPLNQYSAAIIEKYKGTAKPLPSHGGKMVSNQKLNKAIKDLCEKAEINDDIPIVRQRGVDKVETVKKKFEVASIHMGRRTFFTLSLEKGMPIQEVMSLTGHTSFASAKRYLNVTLDKKKAAVAQAWGAAKDSTLKVV